MVVIMKKWQVGEVGCGGKDSWRWDMLSGFWLKTLG